SPPDRLLGAPRIELQPVTTLQCGKPHIAARFPLAGLRKGPGRLEIRQNSLPGCPIRVLPRGWGPAAFSTPLYKRAFGRPKPSIGVFVEGLKFGAKPFKQTPVLSNGGISNQHPTRRPPSQLDGHIAGCYLNSRKVTAHAINRV